MNKHSIQQFIDSVNEKYKDSDKSPESISKIINDIIPEDMSEKDARSLLGRIVGRQIRKSNDYPETKEFDKILEQVNKLKDKHEIPVSSIDKFTSDKGGSFYSRKNDSININDRLLQDQVLGSMPEEFHHAINNKEIPAIKRNPEALPQGTPGKSAMDILDKEHLGDTSEIVKKITGQSLPEELSKTQALKKQLLTAFTLGQKGLKALPVLGAATGIASGTKDYMEADEDPNTTDTEKVLRMLKTVFPSDDLDEEIETQKKARDYLKA